MQPRETLSHLTAMHGDIVTPIAAMHGTQKAKMEAIDWVLEKASQFLISVENTMEYIDVLSRTR